MTKIIIPIALFCLLIGVGAGYALRSPDGTATNAQEVIDWTCSMHPQVSLPAPGLCPICEMKLIPRGKNSNTGPTDAITLSPYAKDLAHIETVALSTGAAIKHLRLSARIERDETQVRAITILGSGRLDTLFANYVGMQVKKGDHLAEIFSPAFTTAAAELLAAQRNPNNNEMIIQSARRKLDLIGVSAKQINEIEQSGKVPQTYTLFSPIDGIVSASHGYQGHWFKEGQVLFELINLQSVWLQMDVYESQLGLIYYGQEVSIQVPSFPGRSWNAVVSFMQPVLNAKSRSIKVRAKIDNSDGSLLPEMFAEAQIQVHLDANNRVIKPILAGKWISPMHPEIISDTPGTCSICGMELVKSEDYLTQQQESAGQALLIPETAPLIIGDQAVVYVETGERQYQPRLVSLGHHVDGAYIVLEGLKAGERVVKRGAFRLDSDLQIQARASMMSMWQKQKTLEASTVKIDPNILEHVRPPLLKVYEQWAGLHKDLHAGESTHLQHRIDALVTAVKAVPHKQDIPVVQQLETHVEALKQHTHIIADLKPSLDVESLALVAETLIKIQKLIPLDGVTSWSVMYCPMVPRDGENEGAYWIQESADVQNPYFLGGMPGCGSLKEFPHD